MRSLLPGGGGGAGGSGSRALNLADKRKLVEYALEDIQKKRHKRDPFRERYLQLCLSSFDARVRGISGRSVKCSCRHECIALPAHLQCSVGRRAGIEQCLCTVSKMRG